VISESLKKKKHQWFHLETGSDALRELTCACCAKSWSELDCEWMSARLLNLDCLRGSIIDDTHQFHMLCPPPLSPYTTGILQNVVLDPSGVQELGDDQYKLNLCISCLKSIKKGKIPALALAN
jgi:hypothetical protein